MFETGTIRWQSAFQMDKRIDLAPQHHQQPVLLGTGPTGTPLRNLLIGLEIPVGDIASLKGLEKRA